MRGTRILPRGFFVFGPAEEGTAPRLGLVDIGFIRLGHLVIVRVIILVLLCEQQARPHLLRHSCAQARSVQPSPAVPRSGAAGKWLAGCRASWASGLGREHRVSQLLRKSGGAPLGCGEESKLASEQGTIREIGLRGPPAGTQSYHRSVGVRRAGWTRRPPAGCATWPPASARLGEHTATRNI